MNVSIWPVEVSSSRLLKEIKKKKTGGQSFVLSFPLPEVYVPQTAIYYLVGVQVSKQRLRDIC